MICSIPDCGRTTASMTSEWCVGHRRRWRLYGDPLAGVIPPGTGRKWFDAHVGIETDECIVWPYGTSEGYGILNVDGKPVRVHALACEAHHGPRPAGMDAAHLPIVCHNRRCINGRHLAWTSRRDNVNHMRLDGTFISGSRKWNAKLDEESATEIRNAVAAGAQPKELAVRYDVSEATIYDTVTGRRWRFPIVAFNTPTERST